MVILEVRENGRVLYEYGSYRSGVPREQGIVVVKDKKYIVCNVRWEFGVDYITITLNVRRE